VFVICKILFIARCTAVQSAVLRFHVVCPSVTLTSVTLVDQDHIGWITWKLIIFAHGQLAQHLRSS